MTNFFSGIQVYDNDEIKAKQRFRSKSPNIPTKRRRSNKSNKHLEKKQKEASDTEDDEETDTETDEEGGMTRDRYFEKYGGGEWWFNRDKPKN